MILYQIENNLSAQDFKTILLSSTLAERRPAEDMPTLEGMLTHANLIITARIEGKIIGVARSMTDFHYCTYLSDLAVDKKHQKKGIGKELIRRTKLETPKANLILLSAPGAVDYYPKIGMKQYPHCFLIRNIEELQ